VGELQALAHAARREHVQVARLVLAALEVLRLDPTLVEQGLEQVVRLAEADAERARDLALRIFGVALEQAQELELGRGRWRQRHRCVHGIGDRRRLLSAFIH
jgi:hypothetical protein